jgi:uncharacterized repeat protein (TIGR01451 family)
MGKRGFRALSALLVSIAMVAVAGGPGFATPPTPGPSGDTPTLARGAQSLDNQLNDETEARLLALDSQFVASRTAGDTPLSIEQAGALRSAAAKAAKNLKHAPPSGPTTFNSAWSGIGPDPIVQIGRSDGAGIAVTGRIGALAIRKDGTFILGAAQGGIWTFDPSTGNWINRTDSLPSLSTGALAVAPSNDLVVYDGTGEGALSGDSYYGNGILKSTDGGMTWSHVSGDFFLGVSISRLAVDPNHADHLYAAVLRGRGGDRRVSPPIHSTYGLWESKDGGVNWTLIKPAPSTSLGATDIRLDPQEPTTLYSSFWGDAIYKSTDGGATWNAIMNGLPAGNFTSLPTRFSLGLSHPASDAQATLYTGFDWVDSTTGKRQRGHVFKSTDGGATWAVLPTGTAPFDTVLDYCTTQCFYDNVIEPDPNNPNIVFVAGSFGYSMPIQSGGIFRSDDGGQTWENLGWDLHPDFHALAFDPNNSSNVLIGNDGGVWFSPDRGGRLNSDDSLIGDALVADLSTADFQNGDLNGGGLQITQFTSIATNPNRPARIWGGSQDNGTERKAAASNTWFDLAGGDGGQVLVDPTKFNYVYGTYFGISPYRITDGGANFFTNQFITNGINPNDRSEFYTPFVLNQNNVNQLFLGTYRLYRTDNAKAASVGDVTWKVISPDLTTGCTGASPNGARNCTLSAIGVGGGTAVYTGSLDGLVYFSPDAQVSSNPTWIRVGVHSNGGGDKHSLPGRPVAWIAVDRSNYRTAYLAYNGYSESTPHQPGHVYKTTDAGASWTDISGNLPDNPVNSLTIDPSYPNTLYAATDVGPFVTFDGGASWSALGTGFPTVAIDQIDLNPGQTPRLIAAGTHGRGAWKLNDSSSPVPALVISKADAGIPVGPGSNLNYTITLRNIGNAAATGVTITDPIPANTTFVSALDGGSQVGGTVTWSGKTILAHGSIAVHFTVNINAGASPSITSVTDDGFTATDAQGQSVTGSPTITKFAPPYGLSLSPATQTGGAHPGQSQTYILTVTNLGFKIDSYNLSVAGGTFAATLYDATCTTLATSTSSVPAGGTANFCVKVAVTAGATDGTSSASTVTATSAASPTTSATATIKTIAVTVDNLLVDEDGNAPDVNAFYTNALTTAGVAFDTWDLNADPNLPVKYIEAFKNIFWFTGTSFPAPIQPYEGSLTAYLNNGGHLFMSGEDLLDQAAGTTPFVHNYLHVTWDGSENQNDRLTNSVTSVAGNPVTNGIGSVPIDLSILGGPGLAFMDQITPNGGALAAFMDDGSSTKPIVGTGPQPDALTFSGTYKVVFLAFPFEEYGSAPQKADLVTRVINFFNAP